MCMRPDKKAHRTALRRDSGNRKPPAPKAPATGTRYLVPHACFACRRSFKVAPRTRPAKCPNCGAALHAMGRSFKAPAARDIKQWTKVKALYDAGFRFFSYRGFDCLPLPMRLADVDAFIRDNLENPFRLARRDMP